LPAQRQEGNHSSQSSNPHKFLVGLLPTPVKKGTFKLAAGLSGKFAVDAVDGSHHRHRKAPIAVSIGGLRLPLMAKPGPSDAAPKVVIPGRQADHLASNRLLHPQLRASNRCGLDARFLPEAALNIVSSQALHWRLKICLCVLRFGGIAMIGMQTSRFVPKAMTSDKTSANTMPAGQM